MENTDLMLYDFKVGQKFQIFNCPYSKFNGKIFTLKEFSDTKNIRMEGAGYGMFVSLEYLKKYCIKMEG